MVDVFCVAGALTGGVLLEQCDKHGVRLLQSNVKTDRPLPGSRAISLRTFWCASGHVFVVQEKVLCSPPPSTSVRIPSGSYVRHADLRHDHLGHDFHVAQHRNFRYAGSGNVCPPQARDRLLPPVDHILKEKSQQHGRNTFLDLRMTANIPEGL